MIKDIDNPTDINTLFPDYDAINEFTSVFMKEVIEPIYENYKKNEIYMEHPVYPGEYTESFSLFYNSKRKSFITDIYTGSLDGFIELNITFDYFMNYQGVFLTILNESIETKESYLKNQLNDNYYGLSYDDLSLDNKKYMKEMTENYRLKLRNIF